MIAEEKQAMLMAKLPASAVSSRQGGGGQMLDYVDGHYVYQTLCDVFGPGGWGYQIIQLDQVIGEMRQGRNGERFHTSWLARLQLTVDGGMPIQDVGYGSGIDRDPGSAIEKASKEAVTDAVKRCARALGPRMGLALYDKQRADVGPDAVALVRRAFGELRQVEGAADMFSWFQSTAPLLAELPSQEQAKARAAISKAAARHGVDSDQLRQWEDSIGRAAE